MRGQLTDIGSLFRALRGKEGVTQKELAKRLEVPQSRISEAETEGRPLNMDTIIKYAAALGYAVEVWFKPLEKKSKKI